jgi:stearoyl-CoA desaturase (delta-9 desaturase)
MTFGEATKGAGTGAIRRLPLPATAVPLRVEWPFANGVILYHLVAPLAFMPIYFSWTGVIAAICGFFVFGVLGINVCYHRLLTHKGFTCPKWLEYGLAILGVCCLQGSPARWVAIHRRHHHASDRQQDPHSPLVNLLWGHVGWVVSKNSAQPRTAMSDPYAKDLIRQGFYLKLERHWLWLWIVIASWLVVFAAGLTAGLLLGESLARAATLGASLLLWGVFLRTVVHWHLTWSVNSVAHRWGYRNYETPDNSRNNIFIGLLGSGEGWHNNHHADPRSARHGHKAWELDLSWWIIRVLAALGLARDVVQPSPNLARRLAPVEPLPG